MIAEWVDGVWDPAVNAPIPRYQLGEILTFNISGQVYISDALCRFRVQRIQWDRDEIRYGGPVESGYGVRCHWTSATESRIVCEGLPQFRSVPYSYKRTIEEGG